MWTVTGSDRPECGGNHAVRAKRTPVAILTNQKSNTMTNTTTTTARKYMKAKTWGKANLVREDFENRHEYRKAAAVGFNAYKQQQEAEKESAKAAKAESAKPKPTPKQETAPAKPVTKADVMADLKKLTKAQLLQVVEFVLQAAPELEAIPKVEAKPEPEAKPKAAKPKAEAKSKPAKTETKPSDGEILWARYSEKCIILYGDTKPSKDAIKAAGGLWRPFMESPDGNRGVWLLSNKAFEKFQSINK